MATTTDTRRDGAPAAGRAHRSPVYSVLIGLASLGVLLQGVWAGAFMREGQEYGGPWLEVHDTGAKVTFVLAALAFVAALVWLRHRVALVVTTGVFALLVFAEAYIGGEIGKQAWLSSVHFPLAMALLALAVYLPVMHRRGAVPTGR